MQIFGLNISRSKPVHKAAGGELITHLPSPSAWWPVIKESFTGAWQRDIVVSVQDALSHPTFWGCVTLIASDVAKCRPKLVESDAQGIKTEVDNPAYSPVLRRPNHYQNRIQFYTYWLMSKLMWGNAYALKERDARGVVVAIYLLDPSRVRPMVSPNGDVYYALQQDLLSGITEASLVVPAREIIHDIAFAPYHPLCGVSPVYACGQAALQALTIASNTTKLFKHGTQNGGILTAPGEISEANQKKLEDWWMANYAGPQNIGRVAVLGGGLKFEKPSMMSAVDAQLIDQLKWDDEKICAVFHVPPYKVGVGPIPSYNNVEALGQEYYGDCLQIHIESMELCLTEGLELKAGYEVEFDLEALNRMDSAQRMTVATQGVVGGVLSPNEARARFNLRPVKGGNTPYLQQQNYSLAALDRRDNAPPAPPLPARPAAEDPDEEEDDDEDEKTLDSAELLAAVLKGLGVAA